MVAILTGVLLATGCAPSTPEGLDPKDKLHCAVALGVTGQNAERDNASADDRRTLFVTNSWYSQRLPDSALVSPEAKQALVLARQDSSATKSVATTCIKRAEGETGFKGFRRRIGAMYDEADAARR